MSSRTFTHAVVAAAVLATLASVLVAGLLPFVGFGSVIRLVIPALAFAYVVYLVRGSDESVGRITTLAAWIAVAFVTWWYSPALPIYLVIHVVLIWLVRSLYYYSSFIPAVMDAGLSALSIAAMTWAATRSGSVFLATWCFFLVQALTAALPLRKQEPSKPVTDGDERFQEAKRQADAALRQIYS